MIGLEKTKKIDEVKDNFKEVKALTTKVIYKKYQLN